MTTHLTIEGPMSQSNNEYWGVTDRVIDALKGMVGYQLLGYILTAFHVDFQPNPIVPEGNNVKIRLRDQDANLITGEFEIELIMMLAMRLNTLPDGLTLFDRTPVVFCVNGTDDNTDSTIINTEIVYETRVKSAQSPTPTTTTAATATAEATTTEP